MRAFSQILILLILTSNVSAEESSSCPDGTPEQRLACLTRSYCPVVVSETDRAECYRRITLTLLSAKQPAAVEAPAIPAVAAPVPLPSSDSSPLVTADQTVAADPSIQNESNFGYEWYEAPREQQRVDEITSRIVFLQTLALGNYFIGLENGQLWQQVAKSRTRLRVGENIRIVRGSLRSYKLFPEKSTSTNVSRVICHGDKPSSLCKLFEDWRQTQD